LKSQIRLQLDQHARLLEKAEAEAEADESNPLKSGAPSIEFCDHILRKVNEYHREQRAKAPLGTT
jgi:hypothetical protein